MRKIAVILIMISIFGFNLSVVLAQTGGATIVLPANVQPTIVTDPTTPSNTIIQSSQPALNNTSNTSGSNSNAGRDANGNAVLVIPATTPSSGGTVSGVGTNVTLTRPDGSQTKSVVGTQKDSSGNTTYVIGFQNNSDGTAKLDAQGNPVYLLGNDIKNGGTSYVTAYDQDPSGKITRMTYETVFPAGNKAIQNVTYDGKSNALSATVNYYDTAGKVIGTETYTRDAATGQLKLVSSNLTTTETANYEPLAPIKGPDGAVLNGATDFPGYLQAIYRIGIGLCFVLGVIMFTWAGIEYIVSESMNTKGDARSRMTNALIGLAIALVSYILLNTINPDLLKLQNINVNVTTTK